MYGSFFTSIILIFIVIITINNVRFLQNIIRLTKELEDYKMKQVEKPPRVTAPLLPFLLACACAREKFVKECVCLLHIRVCVKK